MSTRTVLTLALMASIGCGRAQTLATRSLPDAPSAPAAVAVAELTVASDKNVGIDNTVNSCLRIDRVGRRAVDNIDLLDVDVTAVDGDCGCLSSRLAYEVRDEVPIERAAAGEPSVTRYLAAFGLFDRPKVHQRRRISLLVRADTSLPYAGRVRLYVRCAPPM